MESFAENKKDTKLNKLFFLHVLKLEIYTNC